MGYSIPLAGRVLLYAESHRNSLGLQPKTEEEVDDEHYGSVCIPLVSLLNYLVLLITVLSELNCF